MENSGTRSGRRAQRQYDWTRYWAPPDQPVVVEEEGYLINPEEELGAMQSPLLQPLADRADRGCLVLLGEAGSGKSRELRGEAARLEAAGEPAVLFDLEQFAGGEDLKRRAFEGREVRAWRTGSGRMTLLLDGLDEAVLTAQNLGKVLVGALSDLDPDDLSRLGLRVACRTGAWAQHLGPYLEAELSHLFGASFDVLALAPLRRRDVETAARARGMEPAAFLHAVHGAGAGALAARPITLDLLLDAFTEHGGLPTSRTELYEAGLRALCKDSAERAARTGGVDPGQRLEVAERIAAVTMLCGHAGVWIDRDPEGCPIEDVSLSELAGDPTVQGVPLIPEERLLDTLKNTGLFVPGRQREQQWAHRSFAELLAARYLQRKDVSAGRAVQLLQSPGDSPGRLVPQLYGVAAWLCALDPDVAERVIEAQPEILLQGDPQALDAAMRARLARRLLDAFQSGELHEWHSWIEQRYEGLCYPGMASDLSPFIGEGGRNAVARAAACRMAEACCVKELADDLLAAALDPSQPRTVRYRAAAALGMTGTPEQRRQLEPLARGQAGEDPDDELKGVALRVLFPEHLRAPAVLKLLTEPRDPHFFGAYRWFLEYDLVRGLRPRDLQLALSWAFEDRKPLSREPEGAVSATAAAKLLATAWGAAAADPQVARALARTLVVLVRRYDKHLLEDMAGDRAVLGAAHRAVLGCLAEIRASGDDHTARDAFSAAWALAGVLPLDALLDATEAEKDKAVGRLFADLAVQHVLAQNWAVADEAEQILARAETSSALAEALEPYRQIPLDSAYARHGREQDQRRQQFEARREADRRALRQELDQVERLLADPAASEAVIWDNAFWAASLRPDGRGLEMVSPGDLTERPFWHEAPQHHDRLLSAAIGYLQAIDPQVWKWITTNQIPGPAMLGIQALYLLAKQAPDRLAGMGPGDWERWGPVLLRGLPGEKAGPLHAKLLRLAFDAAPEVLLSALRRLVVHEDQDEERPTLFSMREAELLLDDVPARDAVGEMLLDLLEQKPLRERSAQKILGKLMRHGHAPAGSMARRWAAGGSEEQQRAAAAALLRFAPDAGWDLVWPLLKDHPDQGRRILEALARDVTWDEVMPQKALSDAGLADLYLWLAQQFPGDQDPVLGSRISQPVTWRYKLGRLRDSLLGVLKGRATPSSFAALQNMAKELGHPGWMVWTLREADELLRWRTWVHWEPAELLELVERETRPIIRDDEELQDALLDALEQYEETLQGGLTPRAERLWNGGPPFEPKEEGFLSHEVAEHLRRELGPWGVSISLEEETRRSTGPDTGKRTDFVARRFVPQADGTQIEARCVVEVKRSCNPQVRQSIDSQLVSRYMARGAFRAGIYLVIWFGSERRASQKTSKNQASGPFRSLAEARKWLAGRAQELSGPGLRVRSFVLDASLP